MVQRGKSPHAAERRSPNSSNPPPARPPAPHVQKAVQASLNPSQNRPAPPAHVAKAVQRSTGPVPTRPVAPHVAAAVGQKGAPGGQTGVGAALQQKAAAKPPLGSRALPPHVAQRKGNTTLANATRSRTVQRAQEASFAGLENYGAMGSIFHGWYPDEEPKSAKAEGQRWDQQGWKIHIGTSPRHANDLLAICLPAIRALGIGHKVVKKPSDFEALQDGQAGKLITLYPVNATQFSAAWHKLYPLLAQNAADLDPSPAANHEIVLERTRHMTARYGSFIDKWIRHTETGKKVVEDDRNDPYPPPNIGYVEYPDQIMERNVRQALINQSSG